MTSAVFDIIRLTYAQGGIFPQKKKKEEENEGYYTK